jgi:hypothetical protein
LTAPPDPVVGRRLFTDGVTRPVHRGPDAREYVIGHEGERVYGTWLVPLDEAVIGQEQGRVMCGLLDRPNLVEA